MQRKDSESFRGKDIDPNDSFKKSQMGAGESGKLPLKLTVRNLNGPENFSRMDQACWRGCGFVSAAAAG